MFRLGRIPVTFEALLLCSWDCLLAMKKILVKNGFSVTFDRQLGSTGMVEHFPCVTAVIHMFLRLLSSHVICAVSWLRNGSE